MRPQDIVILLKLISSKRREISNKEMAEELKISASEFSEALERCKTARLIDNTKKNVNIKSLEEFLFHGIKYVFPIIPQGKVRGMPTSISAQFLENKIAQGSDHYVWRTSNGIMRGEEIKPLYKTVPEASLLDNALYELLVLVDILRMGRNREVEIAKKELTQRFSEYHGRESIEN